MKNQDIIISFQEMKTYYKKFSFKSVLVDMLLLLVPCVLTLVIFLLSIYSFFIGLLLIFAVLPMFYTIEKRIRAKVTNIGNANYSFADGYKDFYKVSNRGIFGIISTILFSVGIYFISEIIISLFWNTILNGFGNDAYNAYQEILSVYSDQSTTSETLINCVTTNIFPLAKPIALLFGLVLFFPIGFAVFIYLDGNLTAHELATIVLPDIDKNLPASQSRRLSRTSFLPYIRSEVNKNKLKFSWPFYLGFVLLYALVLFLSLLIDSSNIAICLIQMFLTPLCGFVIALLLNYFVLSNVYIILEHLKDDLLKKMPSVIKTSIRQTYDNLTYIHGEESAFRGSFVPQNTYESSYSYDNSFNSHPSDFSNDTNNSANNNQQSDESPKGIFIDLTKDNKDNK